MGFQSARVDQIKSNLALVSGLAGLLFGLAAYARTPTTAASAISATVPYQGFLELNGVPVNTPRNMSFTFYNDPMAGAVVWGPEVHPNVAVNAGAFAVNLGDTVDLAGPALAGNRWVEVSVEGTVLEQRQLLGSAPFALRAAPGQDFSVDADSAVGGTLQVGGDANVAGVASVGAVAVAGKWRLGDTGDSWLRLYNAAGTATYGGLAANDLYANGGVDTGGINVRGDVVASANHTGACVDVPVAQSGSAINNDDATSGTALTNCPDGYYVAGIRLKHYQENGQFRDRYPNQLHCCQL